MGTPNCKPEAQLAPVIDRNRCEGKADCERVCPFGVFEVRRMSDADYAMPERMDDEWHLHAFDRSAFRALLPPTLRVTRVLSVPWPWLPLRWVLRAEAR